MRVYASVHTHNKIIKKYTTSSDNPDVSRAFLECSEKIYKALDLSEPIWLSKHQRELSRFHRVRFRAEDFLEPISFDWIELEIIDD